MMINERLLEGVDDILTLRGRLSARAKDLAVIGSDETLLRDVVQYRILMLTVNLLDMSLGGVKTSGAFSLGTGGTEYYAGALMGQNILRLVTGPATLGAFERIRDTVYSRQDAIPGEIREKMHDHLISKGIPPQVLHSHAIPQQAYETIYDRPIEDLSEALLTPIIQFLATGEHLSIEAKLGILAAGYLGFVTGGWISGVADRVKYQWQQIQRVIEKRREELVLSSEDLLKKWSHQNYDEYKKQNRLNRLVDFIPRTALALAMLAGNMQKPFGVFSAVSESTQAFGVSKEVMRQRKAWREGALIAKYAAEYLSSGPYLATEKSWKAYCETHHSVMPDSNFDPNILLKAENFQACIGENVSRPATFELRKGTVNFLEGDSGDGKSIFLYALRGYVRSEGSAVINDGLGVGELTQYSQRQLNDLVAYFSPEGRTVKGLRVVDLFSNCWLQEQMQNDVLNDIVARGAMIDDALLERIITYDRSQRNKKGSQAPEDWELNILGNNLSIKDISDLKDMREKRSEWVAEIVSTLGKNLDLIKPDRDMSELSLGMRQRIYLASVLKLPVPIKLLDEPFASIDEKTSDELFRQICRQVKNSNGAVVLVSHAHKTRLRLVAADELDLDSINVIDLRKPV